MMRMESAFIYCPFLLEVKWSRDPVTCLCFPDTLVRHIFIMENLRFIPVFEQKKSLKVSGESAVILLQPFRQDTRESNKNALDGCDLGSTQSVCFLFFSAVAIVFSQSDICGANHLYSIDFYLFNPICVHSF